VEILEDVVVPRNTGHACIVRRQHLLRVMAESTVDLVAFNLDNLYERFDQGRTKANQGKIYLSTGDFLYSKINRVMLSIVDDTYRGTHDLQYGMCSK
jgi:uncharacterized protein YcgI (DUF1989 family)